ncbi:MAG: hypothetical protein RRY97_01930 [Oscillibacter sp.]
MGAPSFKDCIAADVSNVFLNRLEFADKHTVNGKEMTVLVDENELQERDKFKLLGANQNGTYKATRMIYVAKSEFGPRPALTATINLDGREYRVAPGTTEEAGILAIALEAVRS